MASEPVGSVYITAGKIEHLGARRAYVSELQIHTNIPIVFGAFGEPSRLIEPDDTCTVPTSMTITWSEA